MAILVAGGIAGFGEQSLKLFESELKEAVMPFVEKNYRTQNGMPTTGHWPVYHWEDCKHYMPVLKIQTCFLTSAYSVPAGLPISRQLSDPQYEFMKNNASTNQ